jgi:TPR repeat protein
MGADVEGRLLAGRYSKVPEGADARGRALWAFARFHLVPDARAARAAEEAHRAGDVLGTFVLFLCHLHGAAVAHDRELIEQLGYQVRTRLEEKSDPTPLDLYLLSHCPVGGPDGTLRCTMDEWHDRMSREPVRLRRLLEESAGDGCAQACQDLANAHGSAGRVAEAARWHARAAELGLAEGMAALGALLGRGVGVTKDVRRGLELTRTAAEADDVFALIDLATASLSGKLPRDEAAAREWIERAAATGHWAGYLEKGRALCRGWYGFPEEPAAGKRVLQEGARTGHREFLWEMARGYWREGRARGTCDLALRFTLAAFRQGKREAADLLAGLYTAGYLDVAADNDAAYFWAIQSEEGDISLRGAKPGWAELLDRLARIDPFALEVG